MGNLGKSKIIHIPFSDCLIFAKSRKGQSFKDKGSTILAIIPKIPKPTYPTDLIPTACYNATYKCICKHLCMGFKPIPSYLVHDTQSSFIRRRSIIDNILIREDFERLYNREGHLCKVYNESGSTFS